MLSAFIVPLLLSIWAILYAPGEYYPGLLAMLFGGAAWLGMKHILVKYGSSGEQK